MNGESMSMVWPTLGSRTDKEQNICVFIAILSILLTFMFNATCRLL